MRVLFTPSAERQLDSLYNFIANKSSEATADAYIGRIVAHCRKLSDFPERGTRRDHILPGLRTIGFERRVTIAFMIIPDAVLIEGIFYGGRDLEAQLRR